ncbi:MAG: hypothetical protein GY930_02455 [bacterium]|nr:hypothetical protein [bacterium]
MKENMNPPLKAARPLRATIFKALLGSIGLRLAGMAFGFLVGLQLARGMGVVGYGLYGLAMSYSAILTVVCQLGLPQLNIREIQIAFVRQDWPFIRCMLRWSQSLMLRASALAILVGTGILILKEGTLTSPLSLTFLAGFALIPFAALDQLQGAALRGLNHLVKGQLGNVLIRPALHAGLLFMVFCLGSSLRPELALGLSALSAMLSFSVSRYMINSSIPMSKIGSTTPKLTSEWKAAAFPLALTRGLGILQSHIPILLLGMASDSTSIGIYRIAIALALLVTAPNDLFNVICGPILARFNVDANFHKAQRLLSWTSVGMTCSTLLLTLPFIIHGRPLITYIFGEEFSSSNPLVITLCIRELINGAFGTSATLLNMSGHQSRVTRAYTIGLIALTVVATVLVFMYGAMGVAVATVLSATITNTLLWKDSRELLNIDSSLLSFFRPK